MEPNNARPPFGGSPYLEPGVVSPTQPTVITVVDADGVGVGVLVADGLTDGVGEPEAAEAARLGPEAPPPSADNAQALAAVAATTATATLANTMDRRRRSRRRRSLSVT